MVPNEMKELTMKYLNIKEVCERTSLSRSTVYRLIKDGYFPRKIKISKSRVAWRDCEVNAWLQEQQHSEA